MKLKQKEITLTGPTGTVTIKRNSHGIPEISGSTFADLAYGTGWVHANDRQLQVLLTRILVQGRAAELLAGEEELIQIDTYMRRMNFLPDPEKVAAKLKPNVREQLHSYAEGFNKYLSENKPIPEFRLLGYHPEPLALKDVLVIAKIMCLIGLADAQGNMEKLLVQMIQNDVDEKRLRELFPYLKEKIDRDLIKKVILEPPLVPGVQWLSRVPYMIASNNWVISGKRSKSGKPMLCNDPHLEVNRIPSIWQEIVLRLPDDDILGVSLPGVPGVIIGRSRNLAWGVTFAFMDMIDYRIEQCQGGKYRRGNSWKPFTTREEKILVKKGKPITVTVYENEHGILEGDPNNEGYYLAMSWSAAGDCGTGDFNGLLQLPTAKTVKEAMVFLKMVDAGAWNFVVADSGGNIGYQMTGRLFNRPKGVSGLIPLPGWESRYNNRGFVRKDLLPSLYNPKEGFIATSNQDLNRLGKANPINLPMAPYRSDRIAQLLKQKKKCDVEDMKGIQGDLYSLQAEKLMKVITPLLPDSKNGNILKAWDCQYKPDSRGATLFEAVYHSLLKVVFGDNGLGRSVISYLLEETGIFNDYYGNFDTILLKSKSAWFNGKKEVLFKRAIEEGLRCKAKPYGKTRKVMISHLLFGGKLPRFLGFDYGPISLPGSRATIPQGQIFKSAGRTTTFSPGYRIITDMESNEIHTNIAGGPSDRRFSKWYLSDIKNWLSGSYKILK